MSKLKNTTTHSSSSMETSFLKVVMKNMTIRLTLVILLISTISYFYFEHTITGQLKDQIQTYTNTKSKNESLYYGALRDDLTLVINHFNKKLKEPTHDLAINDLSSVVKMPDGSIRNNENTFNPKEDVAIYIPTGVTISAQYLKIITEAKNTITAHRQLVSDEIWQIWFVPQQNGLISYAPKSDRQKFYNKNANFSDNQEIYYRLSETDLNPDRKMIWSKPYFDNNLKVWKMSLIAPVYQQEEQIGSFGIDILLSDINERINFKSNIGITAAIIDEGGNIISHPKFQTNILSNKGNFTIQEANDPTLNEVYTKISLISKLEKSITLATEHHKKIVGIAKITNTPWFIITEQDTEYYATSLYGHLRFSIIISILSLIIEIFIIYRTLNKEVLYPIQDLIDSINHNMKNNFNSKISTKNNNELAEMTDNYNHLIDEIKKKEELITNYQNILEEKVSNRTMQLNAALKHADEANTKAVYTEKMASLGEMASGIAHEINNPLQIIQLSLSTLDKMTQKDIDHERALKTVKKIDNTADRILEIIRGLDQFSNDKADLPLEEKNLLEIVQQSQEHTSAKLKDHQVSIEIKIDPYLKIFCLKTQIVQVFINLIQNSLDALENLSIEHRWIHIRAEQNSSTVFVYFQDGGKGIPVDIQQKLMTPFFTTKEIGKGTGLGLSIIKGIMTKHRGSVHYDNQEKHTTFVLKFPRKNQN